MREQHSRRDLYVLVADEDMLQAMKGLLSRSPSLGIRPIKYAIARHVHRDPGCRATASQYLRSHIRQYQRALVVFDKRGCGDDSPREEIQDKVKRDLEANGWMGRSKAIVIDPELENWVWNGSEHVPRILGWKAVYGDLKEWLVSRELWESSSAKPSEPKKAMRAALRKGRRNVSAQLFGQLAGSVSLQSCLDPAFLELKETLQSWFPAHR